MNATYKLQAGTFKNDCQWMTEAMQYLPRNGDISRDCSNPNAYCCSVFDGSGNLVAKVIWVRS